WDGEPVVRASGPGCAGPPYHRRPPGPARLAPPKGGRSTSPSTLSGGGACGPLTLRGAAAPPPPRRRLREGVVCLRPPSVGRRPAVRASGPRCAERPHHHPPPRPCWRDGRRLRAWGGELDRNGGCQGRWYGMTCRAKAIGVLKN